LPLRMMAFLSPAKISAKDEFEAICSQVLAARQGLALTCSIYLGEQGLLDEKSARIQAGELPGIEVDTMPSSALEFEQVIRNQPPQLLHFFCHGVTDDAGERVLEFATINDWDLEHDTGSMTLTIERLRQVLISTGITWSTVLNSCCGARAVEQLHSMALALAQSASPVTVGMAEPIDAGDATVFARAYYGRLFEILGTSLAGLVEGDAAVLDLAPAVNAARAELHQKYQNAATNAFGRWSLPLLYERDTPLMVMRIPNEIKPRIELVAGLLRSLPPTTPRAVRTSVLQKFPEVPEKLRPDIFGNLA
jgi:CHAT domain